MTKAQGILLDKMVTLNTKMARAIVEHDREIATLQAIVRQLERDVGNLKARG